MVDSKDKPSVAQTEAKPKPSRCEQEGCKKKIGLTDFACKCGHHYCAQHRVCEAHKCTFDFFKEGQKELLKFMSSPVIGPKVAVI